MFARQIFRVVEALLVPPSVPQLWSQSRWITDEARTQISKAVKAHPVVLFMKGDPEAPRCGFSRAVSQVITAYEVPKDKLKTYDVLVDPELRQSIKEFSDWPTIPQLYVNGEFVGGCDIVLDMHKTGQLEKLLEDTGVIPKIDLPEESAKA
ncbi:putative GRX5-glutaredoxin [Serendipita vermifera]|nr:putative GRX5-glutaredoxin [Serendipita vermifera]